MSTPELEQALAAAKWKGAEQTLSEVIAKTLDVDIEVVRRVVYAWDQIRNRRFPKLEKPELVDCLFDGLGHGDHIDDDVKEAIVDALDLGVRRSYVRQAMLHNRKLDVAMATLIPEKEVRRVCDGCPTQVVCVMNMLMTPEKCRKGDYVKHEGRYIQYAMVKVTPRKLVGNHVTVEADHPRGTYKLNITDILL